MKQDPFVGDTVQNLEVRTTWNPEFVHPWFI
jgi:hypothetical protein